MVGPRSVFTIYELCYSVRTRKYEARSFLSRAVHKSEGFVFPSTERVIGRTETKNKMQFSPTENEVRPGVVINVLSFSYL